MGYSIELLINKKRWYIVLFFLVLAIFTLKFFFIVSQSSNKILLTNTLDFSWQSDIVQRFLSGHIAGRDFIFTYGPVYQFFASLPSLIFGVPSFTSVLFAPAIFSPISVILFYLISKFVFIEKKDQILLTLFLSLIFSLTSFTDGNSLIRAQIPLLFGLIYFNYFNKSKKIKKLSILSIPALLGLYIFDLFVNSLTIVLGFMLFSFFKNVKAKISFFKYFFSFLLELIVLVLFLILVSLVLSGSLEYILNSFQTLYDYKYIMNIPLSINVAYFLFLIPVVLWIITTFIFKSNNIKSKKNFYVLSLVSIVGLGSSVIRTDEGHIMQAVFPSLIALATIIFVELKKNIKFVFLFIFLILFILFRQKYSEVFNFETIKQFGDLFKKESRFDSFYKLPKDYYLTTDDRKYISRIITQNPGKVLVYPYDSYLLNVKNQTFNTFPLQFYEYSGSMVEEKAVRQLAKSPPKFIIYSLDRIGINPLDNISNFSRNPFFTKWIINNYSVEKNKKKYLVLKFDTKGSYYRNEDCSLYSLNIKNLFTPFPFENLLKTSTYYLNNDRNLRLPYTGNHQKILIFDNAFNSDKIANLINHNVDFNKFKLSEKKNLRVIKKPAIPITLVSSKKIEVECYL